MSPFPQFAGYPRFAFAGNHRSSLLKKIVLLALLLAAPGTSFGTVRVLFSHQSVGRYAIGDPERALPQNRAALPLRSLLNADVAFWDHDYYNYWLDGVTNAVLDPPGNNFAVATGFGSFRGSETADVVMSHLLGEAFTDGATGSAQAFRDSCLSRFDIVMIKPGYHDMHMNTASSLAEYKAMLIGVSDWWHRHNLDHGTRKILVAMTSSSLRHPSDYSDGTSSWPNTAAGYLEAEADAAAYRELDSWMATEWVARSPYTRFFSTWSLCVNHSGSATELNFTKDIFTGTGIGNSSGDHHLNSAGSDSLQAALAAFINALAQEYSGTSSAPGPIPSRGASLFEAVPNPFNPSTRIGIELESPGTANLSIYDFRGQLIATLLNEALPAGRRDVTWDGRDGQGRRVASGVYFSRLEAGDFAATGKLVLVK